MEIKVPTVFPEKKKESVFKNELRKRIKQQAKKIMPGFVYSQHKDLVYSTVFLGLHQMFLKTNDGHKMLLSFCMTTDEELKLTSLIIFLE